MITQTNPNPTTSTQTSQEVAQPPDAAAQWKTTIKALEAYKRECEELDRADEVAPQDRTFEEDLAISRRAYEVERSLDDLARECRRLDSEATATAKPKTKKG